MPHSRAARPALRGFTLIELMVTLVVAALLIGLALPTFQAAVRKGRRADAFAALTQIQQAQERYRANNATYASSLGSTQLNLPTTSQDGHYTLALVEDSATATAYTAQATARSGSPQSKDTDCLTLRISMNGGNLTYSSTSAGGTTTTATGTVTDPCWIR